MLPANPLLQLVPARVTAVLTRLRDRLWQPAGAVHLEAGTARAEHRPWAVARHEPVQPVTALPDHWGHLWDQRWFRLTLDPATAQHGDLYLAWDDQAEATLYVDGLPHYGFDPAHRHAPLPAGNHELWIEAVACQTGIWIEGASGLDAAGSKLAGARLLQRDGRGLGPVPRPAGARRPAAPAAAPRIRQPTNRASRVSARGQWSARSIRCCAACCAKSTRRSTLTRPTAWPPRASAPAHTFEALRAAPTALRAVLTGHAHVDLVWLWPENVGEFKAVHTFATANRLMAAYPEFRFGYSQPASYEAVGRRSPEMMAAVRERLASGQWDATGATEVESDTLLACGEGPRAQLPRRPAAFCRTAAAARRACCGCPTCSATHRACRRS